MHFEQTGERGKLLPEFLAAHPHLLVAEDDDETAWRWSGEDNAALSEWFAGSDARRRAEMRALEDKIAAEKKSPT